MIKRLVRKIRYWYYYWTYGSNSRIPSWRVVYSDGRKSYPLNRETVVTLAALYEGKIEYCRDYNGDLV